MVRTGTRIAAFVEFRAQQMELYYETEGVAFSVPYFSQMERNRDADCTFAPVLLLAKNINSIFFFSKSREFFIVYACLLWIIIHPLFLLPGWVTRSLGWNQTVCSPLWRVCTSGCLLPFVCQGEIQLCNGTRIIILTFISCYGDGFEVTDPTMWKIAGCLKKYLTRYEKFIEESNDSMS